MKECNETITVYNRHYDDSAGLDVWAPTVIKGVSWYKKTETAITDSGLKSATKCVIRIPSDSDTEGKTYVDPINYSSPATTFTLAPGDVVILGTCNTCTNPAELKKHHPDMVTIFGATNDTRRKHGEHFKVVAE